jgi:hypothetical protein
VIAAVSSKTVAKDQSSLPITEDYQVIRFKGKSYKLPPQRARIVKALDEARMSGIDQLSTQAIQREAGCGKKICDFFRTGDGPKLWKTLVIPIKGCHGMYKLNLPTQPAE